MRKNCCAQHFWQYRVNRQRRGNVSESVDYAIALQIRPKLMTAIGAVLALMPLALGIGLGAQMPQSLAIAVIGGFVVGLPITSACAARSDACDLQAFKIMSQCLGLLLSGKNHRCQGVVGQYMCKVIKRGMDFKPIFPNFITLQWL